MDIHELRGQFPALAEGRPGSKTIFFDGAAGTQIAARALARMNDAMIDANSNFGGMFDTSRRAGELVSDARAAMVDFFNANDPREIVFGQNMTTLTLALARTFGRKLNPGDELVVTRMDHDANVAPWLSVAEDRGLTVKWIDFDPTTYEYDLTQLDNLLNARTRLVAVNYASNVLGTINDVRAITARAKAACAQVFVDAVQYAPHGVIDVREIGCDFLVCSAYKFYGPHYGILWGKLEALEALQPYKVRTAPEHAPDKYETGTKSREAMAGTLGAVEHFAWIGEKFGSNRRARIVAGLDAVREHEDKLSRQLIDGLSGMKHVKIHGITKADALARRVPTFALTFDGVAPIEVAKKLASSGINVWHGHNYGWEPVRRLGLLESGGVVRVSLAQYNTPEEVQRFLESVAFGF